jgi:hypothetical protein
MFNKLSYREPVQSAFQEKSTRVRLKRNMFSAITCEKGLKKYWMDEGQLSSVDLRIAASLTRLLHAAVVYIAIHTEYQER